ncbi:N-acetyl sugar amidotransferase [Vineibacter terrae]|uniref:N-acetyl sugar amidotransferase n=1 Tax=Vineibacter terrae TaxID=2586908 RepID=A0A5C8PQR1_9HYPH|nr:N-acetyl sugar amidotransferase [Vineibacter terrae]TXL77076.1 N-acetyl sugar amidotransferase [Vineibacter terrae]
MNLVTKHGLPQTVIFCRRCVMSNQRPSTSPEFRKKSSDIGTAAFGDDGICDACRYAEYKAGRIDWSAREKELLELCARHRRKDGSYDVIVPGSGGKDSIFVTHLLKYKYGMNPLTVTWAPHIYTDIGWKNFQNWLKSGFDSVLVTPNPKAHSIMTRLAFLNLVNPFQPFILGQKIAAPRVALQYNVPLIMYGENQAECHNVMGENFSPLMDIKHFTRESTSDRELYFGGVHIDDMAQHGVPLHEMNPYLPLLREDVVKARIEVHYMSYYVPWSPQYNYYYAKEHAAFEPNPDGRSEGTYSKYASLDDRIDGQHYFTMFVKFGQGRAMNDACRDIRDGHITREEGVVLCNKYDGEFPKKYFGDFLGYVGLDEDKYWEVVDSARSPHLWGKDGNAWVLKHQTR